MKRSNLIKLNPKPEDLPPELRALSETAFEHRREGRSDLALLGVFVSRRPRHRLASELLFFSLAYERRDEEALAEALRFLRLRKSPGHREILAELSENLAKGRVEDPELAKKCRAALAEAAKIPIRTK